MSPAGSEPGGAHDGVGADLDGDGDGDALIVVDPNVHYSIDAFHSGGRPDFMTWDDAGRIVVDGAALAEGFTFEITPT